MGVAMIGEEVARTVNGFAPTAEGEAWVLDVYAPALGIIADFFVESTGQPRAAASRFAGDLLARLAHHDPPIGVERIR